MSKKFYVLIQGFYETEIIKASSDKNKLERYIEAVRKRNSTDAVEMDIVELDEYDDSYLKNIPEEPIYQLRYNTDTNRFEYSSIRILRYSEEEYFIAVNGECKCIQHVPKYIEVYVRAKDRDEAIENAKKSITEYLKSKGMN